MESCNRTALNAGIDQIGVYIPEEALIDGKFSPDGYMNALGGAVADFRAGLNGQGGEPLPPRFAALIYHAPFPKIAYEAHLRSVGEDEAFARGTAGDLSDARAGFCRFTGVRDGKRLYDRTGAIA